MMHGLKIMEHQDFLALKGNAAVIESDLHGEKVLRLTDGRIIKLFRRKHLITSASLYPYARRFADNAEILALRGVPVPRVIDTRRIPAIKRDMVLYWPLEGTSLRALNQAGLDAERKIKMKQQFTDFVIYLHSRGIYFRSLHLGNVILTPAGALGLIDFSDLRTYSRPLPVSLRRRNIRRMLEFADERDWVDSKAIIDSATNKSSWGSFLLESLLRKMQEIGLFRW